MRICSACRKKQKEINDDSSFDISSQSVSFEDEQSSRLQQLEQLLSGLKEAYSNLSSNDTMRLRIVTIAPPSWSIRLVAREFKALRRIVKKAKELREMRSVLATTTSKSGKKFSQKTISKVIDFFNNNSYSRIMPGKKDVVSIKMGDKRKLVQKRLLLSGLRELHEKFMGEHPISISTFTNYKLRSKNCVFADSAGTHFVCVCTIHENPKLKLVAINIETLTKSSQYPVTNYKV